MIRVPKFWGVAFTVLAASAVLFCTWYPPIQTMADAQVDAGLRRALLSFATARGLNAVISVVQGTELSVQPLGVGVTLTLGQVLDPINDLVEQFSTLMLWASISFGVQKAILALIGQWVLSVFVSALVLAWLAFRLTGRMSEILTKLLLVVLLVRFAVPVVTLASDFVFRHSFAQEYSDQQKVVEGVTAKVGEISKQLAPKEELKAEPKGWLERFKDKVANSMPANNVSYEAVKKTVEDLPERLVRLMVIFLLQTLFLPLLFLWLLFKLVFGVSWPSGGPVARPSA